MLVLKLATMQTITLTNAKTGEVIVISDQPSGRIGFECSNDWIVVRSDAGDKKPRQRDGIQVRSIDEIGRR